MAPPPSFHPSFGPYEPGFLVLDAIDSLSATMLVGARSALITSFKRQRACFAVPPRSSQSGRRSSEDGRDFGDVAIDAKESSKSYTVEQAAEMAKAGVERAEEKVESFGEKTRRTVQEAWDAAKDTTKEIAEGVKRREEDGDRVAGMCADDKEKNF